MKSLKSFWLYNLMFVFVAVVFFSIPVHADAKLKVGFVYVGPIGDAGWTWSHDLGRKYLVKNVPDVEATFIENVPEGGDAERIIREMVNQGTKVIFTTAFGYIEYVKKIAKDHPEVVFMHCSGEETLDNLGSYFGRLYQSVYLSGIAAGKMTKTNIIGRLASFPIPEVIRGINAFALGVRSVSSDAVVRVVWTNAWYDPATASEAARTLIEAGADVISQTEDSPAAQVVAQKAGVYSVGYYSDMSAFAPNAHLTAPVWNWGPYYVKIVEAVKQGTWKPGIYWGGINDGITDIAPFGSMVPDEVQKMIMKKRQDIISGKLKIFTGPLKDQAGKIRVPEGETMSDVDLWNMDWFVMGVKGKK